MCKKDKEAVMHSTSNERDSLPYTRGPAISGLEILLV